MQVHFLLRFTRFPSYLQAPKAKYHVCTNPLSLAGFLNVGFCSKPGSYSTGKLSLAKILTRKQFS